MLLSVTVFITCLLFLPLHTDNASAAGAHAAPEGHAAAAGHGAGDELPGEVPFDRPVEEIARYLAPMNKLSLFPCSDCHDESWETNFEKRELGDPHGDIPGQFINHDADNRWCLDCHNAKNRDNLRLINGNQVKFSEYYKLCEQCHRRIYREWKMGVHGKRTGNWNGDKEYMHCTQCHNPHNPPFKAIQPMPAPRKPLEIRTSVSSGDQPAPAGANH